MGITRAFGRTGTLFTALAVVMLRFDASAARPLEQGVALGVTLVDRIFNAVTPLAWDRAFALPLATPPTPNFGARSVFNGEARSPHAGIDFNSPTGTVVTAPAAGTVALADDLFFTGNTVRGAGCIRCSPTFRRLTLARARSSLIFATEDGRSR